MERRFLLERAGDWGFVQYYVDGFDSLSLADKTLAYYFCRAAQYGDPVTYQQIHPEGYRIKRIFEGIVRHSNGIKPEVIQGSKEYLRLYRSSHGFHHRFTGEKFIPDLRNRWLGEAVMTALSNGAEFGFRAQPEANDILTRLNPALFGTGMAPEAAETAETGQDICRSGNDTLPPGRYGAELEGVVDYLREAERSAGSNRLTALEKLSAYFETGDSKYINEYYAGSSVSYDVDLIIGFGDSPVASDFRENLFQGAVFIADKGENDYFRRIFRLAESYLPSFPVYEKHNKPLVEVSPVFPAQLLTAAGYAGYYPLMEAVYSSGDGTGRAGGKHICFTNVWEALRRAESELGAGLASDEVKDAVKAFGVFRAVFAGDDFGRNSYILDRKAALREAAAELAALRALGIPETIEEGLISGDEAVRAGYRWWLESALRENAFAGDFGRHQDCRSWGRELIFNWLYDKAQCITISETDNEIRFSPGKADSIQWYFGQLMNQIAAMRFNVKSKEVKDFFESYDEANPRAKNFAARRAEMRGYPHFYGIAGPIVYLHTTAMGKITDVKLEYPMDMETYAAWVSDMSFAP